LAVPITTLDMCFFTIGIKVMIILYDSPFLICHLDERLWIGPTKIFYLFFDIFWYL